VLRIASLVWRLRRIIAIETDLFQIQAEILCDHRNELAPAYDAPSDQTPLLEHESLLPLPPSPVEISKPE
jgi:hypothetical protein